MSVSMKWNDRLWQQSQQYLSQFLIPLAEVFGRRERRVAATRSVTGILVPGRRNSIALMSDRLGFDPYSLQQFVSESPWEARELWFCAGRAERAPGQSAWRPHVV